MADDVAFDVPVPLPLSEQPIRTVGEAASFVRSRLQAQFTMDRLTTLLVLERAAEGSEIAEARHCFCALVFKELAPVTQLRARLKNAGFRMARMPQPKAFNHAGFVKINEQFYPCQVHEMSMTGARLDLAYPFDLPDTFTLQLTIAGAAVRSCYLIWQEGGEAGVSFEPFTKTEKG